MQDAPVCRRACACQHRGAQGGVESWLFSCQCIACMFKLIKHYNGTFDEMIPVPTITILVNASACSLIYY